MCTLISARFHKCASVARSEIVVKSLCKPKDFSNRSQSSQAYLRILFACCSDPLKILERIQYFFGWGRVCDERFDKKILILYTLLSSKQKPCCACGTQMRSNSLGLSSNKKNCPHSPTEMCSTFNRSGSLDELLKSYKTASQQTWFRKYFSISAIKLNENDEAISSMKIGP